MSTNRRIIVALAACALSAAAGCYRESVEVGPPSPQAADVGPPRRPGDVAPQGGLAAAPERAPASPAFEDAVARLSADVSALRTVAADDVIAQHRALRRAMRHLARAIEQAPARGRGALQAAAADVRGAEDRMSLSAPAQGDALLAARDALGAASDALVGLARGPYRDDPVVVARIFDFEERVRALRDPDAFRTPPAAIVDALRQAELALEAIRSSAPAR